MAGLTPKKVAGRHLILFETFYLALDPTSKGSIGAADAANFLKRSQLSDTILSKIWDLSDTSGKGALDKLGFFTSLKLVALAQNGKEVTPAGLLDDSVPEPEMDAKAARNKPAEKTQVQMPPQPKPVVPPQPAKSPAMDWTPKEAELNKYNQMYISRGPENGKIPGAKAKSLLMESQLPVEKLGKIWDLADADKDGSLSEAEFIIAMHLVCKCLETGGIIPDVLPTELQKLITPTAPPAIPPLPVSMQPPPSSQAPPVQMPTRMANAPLVPTMQRDNWVVPLEDRAKYRNLFETTDLDRDGFVSGSEIKGVFLQSGLSQNILAHIWNLCDTDQSGKLNTDLFALAMWFVQNALVGIAPPSALSPEMIPPSMRDASVPREPELSPEFELIIKEINELSRERINLEDEITSKDSEKKIKTGEIKSLQSELDTLSATLKQLENQKAVAVGKLGELEGQVSTLRQEAEEQESILITQELELSSKAAELQSLDKEEHDVLAGLEQYSRDIEKLGSLLQDVLLQISQNKTRVTSLGDLKTVMEESVIKFAAAIESNNVYTITEPELRDVKSELDELLEGSASPYLNGETAQSNGFESFEPSYPEATKTSSWGNDFERNDAFAPKDPFAPHDPFAPSGAFSGRQDISPGKDPFGAEPFAEEAAPALPPKKPPPRPAPPKNAPARPPPPSMKPPPPSKGADPFPQTDMSSGFGDFADFANFDNQDPWSSRSSSQQQLGQSSSSSVSNQHLEFTEDPFKNYRYEDPFASNDPFR